MSVGDWSGNQWISMFSSEFEKILGKTSQEVGEIADGNIEVMTNLTNKAHFKEFVIKFRVKAESYNVSMVICFFTKQL